MSIDFIFSDVSFIILFENKWTNILVESNVLHSIPILRNNRSAVLGLQQIKHLKLLMYSGDSGKLFRKTLEKLSGTKLKRRRCETD